MKKLFSLCCALLLPSAVVLAASPVILENPPVLFFSQPDTLNIAQIEKMVLEGIIRSNMPNHVWSVESRQPGQINAKVVVRNKHTAFLDIRYDATKVLVSYKSSENLDYEKTMDNYEIIHPNYLKWVDHLVSSLKLVVQFAGNGVVLDESVAQATTRNAGERPIVIAAYAVPGEADSGNRLTRSTNDYSRVFLALLAKHVHRTRPDDVGVVMISDIGISKSLIDESRDNPVSQDLCKQYNASKLFIGNSPSNPGGRGTRYVTYYLYICDNGRKFKERYTIERSLYDSYGYQGAYNTTVVDFMDYSKIYR